MCTVALLTLAACSSTDDRDATDAIPVTISDYEVEVTADVPAGTQRVFDIYNEGPTVHELVLIRTDLDADSLPLAADGVTADEGGLAPLAANEYIAVDEHGALTADLEPGAYILFCNLPGHYQAGMVQRIRAV